MGVPVTRLVKRIARCIQRAPGQAVSGAEIIDLVRSGNLIDEILNRRVDRQSHGLQDVDLANLALIVEIREYPVSGSAGEDGGVRLYFLPVSELFVVRVKEKLVFDDVPSDRSAELILVQVLL